METQTFHHAKQKYNLKKKSSKRKQKSLQDIITLLKKFPPSFSCPPPPPHLDQNCSDSVKRQRKASTSGCYRDG